MGWLGLKILGGNEVESALRAHDPRCHPYGKETVLTSSMKRMVESSLVGFYIRSFSSHSRRDLSVSQAERGGRVRIEPRVDQGGQLATHPNGKWCSQP